MNLFPSKEIFRDNCSSVEAISSTIAKLEYFMQDFSNLKRIMTKPMFQNKLRPILLFSVKGKINAILSRTNPKSPPLFRDNDLHNVESCIFQTKFKCHEAY